MDGPTLVAIVERELKRKRIRKAEFYRAIGITSATFSYWRNNIYSPSVANMKAISEFLGLELSITLNAQGEESLQKNTAAPQGDGVEAKKERLANGEARINDLPEDIQKLVTICEKNPALASALLALAQQIETPPSGRE